jgi:hypothetical protein
VRPFESARVQRVFGNSYTEREPLKDAPVTADVPRPAERLRASSRARPIASWRRPRGRFALLAALSALAAIASVGSAAAAGLGPIPATSVGAHPYSTYSNGRVVVVVPKALPGVDLFQVANGSIGAELVLENVFELHSNPLNPDQPRIVRAATPAAAQQFNASVPTGPAPAVGTFALNFSAQLHVASASQVLWQEPQGTFVASPAAILPTQPTTIVASFALLPSSAGSASQGVSVGWTVANWPWQNASDSLAAEFEFVVATGTGFVGCASSAALLAPSPNCPGSALAPDAILCEPGINSVQGNDAQGPASEVRWSPTARAGATTVPASMCAYYAAPGTSRIAVATESRGATTVTESGSFSLLAPIPPPIVALVRGNPPVYAGALALFAAAAVGGVVVYRLRDRRLRERL